MGGLRRTHRDLAGVLAAVALCQLGGCSWFGWFHRPAATAAPVAAVVPSAPTYPDAQPESAARAACGNYQTVFATAEFPRDAIIRGLDGGRATVWFQVDGTKLAILSVASSDPAFGAAAAETVQRLTCRTDAATVFMVPLAWRSKR